ncbi:hypothetical protein LTR66_004939 [Elasticomyces elasticus]|nr:hypothetical protein LTR66_004939 [Elasticomyces elasticus]KAK5011541.1 hypothetical protein LTR28_000205 [Elasticomyces elasticus]
MAAALEILGMRTYHSILWFTTNLGDTDMWLEAIDAKFYGKGERFTRAEWDQLLHDFGGVSSDTPAIAFSEDLIEAYPEAKVVLTYRDVDDWYKSFKNSVVKHLYSRSNNFIADINPSLVGRTREPHRRVFQGWMGVNSKEEMLQKMKASYVEHYETIRRVTPPERLLEFRLSDGWEPLCKFLGKPIPDVPFPHLNDKAELDKKIADMIKKGLMVVTIQLMKWAIPTGIAFLALRYYVMAK